MEPNRKREEELPNKEEEEEDAEEEERSRFKAEADGAKDNCTIPKEAEETGAEVEEDEEEAGEAVEEGAETDNSRDPSPFRSILPVEFPMATFLPTCRDRPVW